ncbi:MAG TPA: hypothetical protein VHX61_02510 [Rhizomicrobium sp.]|jgi:hypothetical protein|nr:hypothetical protein [Rhizomicrobium sp.]
MTEQDGSQFLNNRMNATEDKARLAEVEHMASQRFVILLSHERSGSHYLVDMLTSQSPIASLDEICNFNSVNPDKSRASFFRFQHETGIRDSELMLRPNAETRTRFMDLYLRHLAGLVDGQKKILLDIKYGHVHNFEIGWCPSERRPFLLDYLERRNVPVVHLTRADSIAAVASSMIAEKTGVWHRRNSDAEEVVAKVPLPTLKVAYEALALEREKDNFFGWLPGCRFFNVGYEQLAGPETVRSAIMTRVCSFLGLPDRTEFPSRHSKVTPPLGNVVQNFDEVMRVVRLFGGGRLRMVHM